MRARSGWVMRSICTASGLTQSHLVCSCLGVRCLRGSLCSQVWNGCSHPAVATLSGSQSVWARGPGAGLEGLEESTAKLSQDAMDSSTGLTNNVILMMIECFHELINARDNYHGDRITDM